MAKRKISDHLIIAANQKIKEREYWLMKLSGELVKSHFQYDNLNPQKEESANNGFVTFNIKNERFQQLMKLSNGADFRLHMILMACLITLLHKYTGHTDIIVGSPIYKQDKDVEFINTILPLRIQMETNMTFKELLLQVRQVVVEATENQNYPIEVLEERLNLTSLFDVMLLVENIHHKKYIQHIHTNTTFSFLRKDKSIEGVVEYNPRCYEGSKIERIISHYENLLNKAIPDVDLPLVNLDILGKTEKKQLLFDFNLTERKFTTAGHTTQTLTLREMLQNQVEKTPDNMAVLYEDQNVTYKTLNERANQVASAIRTKGVTPDGIVALMVEPSIEMVTGILAIVKTGSAYLAIDTDYPENRITYMLKDSGTNLLITKGKTNHMSHVVKESINLENRVLFQRNKNNIDNIILSNNIAYVIYTSGTTGNPKGVLVEHGNVMAYLDAFYNEFEISSKDIILQQASYAFDVFVEELYPVLFRGGEVVIISPLKSMDISCYTNISLKIV